jgi:hypothetical protein
MLHNLLLTAGSFPPWSKSLPLSEFSVTFAVSLTKSEEPFQRIRQFKWGINEEHPRMCANSHGWPRRRFASIRRELVHEIKT